MEPHPRDAHLDNHTPSSQTQVYSIDGSYRVGESQANCTNSDHREMDALMDPRAHDLAEQRHTDDVENRPPVANMDIFLASSNSNEQNNLDNINHIDEDPLVMDVGIVMEEPGDIMSQHLAPPRGFVPGPLREEPTLKEKLVDRERQRRKEAERARLKRQFALMSNNGGGLIYDNAGGGGGASITGTVGEESTHADMEDSISGLMHSHNDHHHQGGDTAPHLGYTMERFLQETATTLPSSNDDITNVIREETTDGGPNTAGAPDKGVVMERFLNDPVVVDTTPPQNASSIQEDTQISSRGDDVHRSVSFDVELRTSYNNPNNSEGHRTEENMEAASDTLDDHHLSIDDSNASIRVEVAPEDDILEPVSPGGHLSVPYEVAPSSRDMEDHHHGHRHRENSDIEISLGSVGPSMDRQSMSSNANNETDSADEPRVLRLTEAEIQEMAAIEEASIGNAPPSDRDSESLVGDLVGTFSTAHAGEAGTNFSQETTTTAMESGSILSGNPLHALRSSAMQGDQHRGNMNDLDHNSVDDLEMSASVSLVVSPDASISGSAVSVTANPPSEIIGRGESTTMLEGDDDRHESLPAPPSSVVVECTSEMQPLESLPDTVSIEENEDATYLGANLASLGLPPASCVVIGESRSSVAIREELKATIGPPAEEIVNRRLRPGMLEGGVPSPHQSRVAMRDVSPLPDNVNGGSNISDTPVHNRTVDEFDFDKHELPMTPRSLLSDSLRDLPDDDELWTSPRTKMTVSPINSSGNALNEYLRRDPNRDSILAMPAIPDAPAALSTLECAFVEILMNNSSAVEAKESELYSRGSIQSNALEKGLPLLVTFMIELPVLRMISQNEKLCSLLGWQHYQLLLGFLPIVAAISGNTSAQASALTTTAICHRHVTAQNYVGWIQKESKVAALLGLGVGCTIGTLAFFVTGAPTKENMAFAVAIGSAAWISSTSAGWTGSNFPILICLLFKQNARKMSGLVGRGLADLMSTFLATFISYFILLVFVPPVNPSDACMT